MFASFTTIFATTLLAIASVASAGPVMLRTERIVYNPTIVSPKAGDAWVGGSQQMTWSTDGMPSEVASSTGLILLGYNTEDGSENLDTKHPLAYWFPMDKGSVTFTVPEVENRTDYRVVLFGDSGNESPAFTITNTTDSGLSSWF